jgi:hypothetical protein
MNRAFEKVPSKPVCLLALSGTPKVWGARSCDARAGLKAVELAEPPMVELSLWTQRDNTLTTRLDLGQSVVCSIAT